MTTASEHATSRLRGVVVAVAAAVAATLALTACSGGSGSTGAGGASSASVAPSSAASGGGVSSGAAAGRRGGNFPGAPAAFGLIAQITGTTMQVQNPQTGQVAVSWTATTTFTQAVAESLNAVKVGDCVVATGASGTSRASKSFTAATLLVMPTSSNACTRTAGQRPSAFPSRSRPSDFPSRGPRPSGGAFPSARPSGARGAGAPGAFATGKVTSVSATTLVVQSRDFARRNSTSAPRTATTPRTIKTTSKTKITTQASTTARSLRVGKCVAAQGTADSSGAVNATSVAITGAVGGRCTGGVGRSGGFGGRNGG